MGNWNINIQGVGAHHNKDNVTDANRMAADFVESLRKTGHTIQVAMFTTGSCEELGAPEASYLRTPGELSRVYALLRRYQEKFGELLA